jgi:hypothetical protein
MTYSAKCAHVFDSRSICEKCGATRTYCELQECKAKLAAAGAGCDRLRTLIAAAQAENKQLRIDYQSLCKELRAKLTDAEAQIVRMKAGINNVSRLFAEGEADRCFQLAVALDDTKRLDWLEAHPSDGQVVGGAEDGAASKAWVISCDPKWTLRETIDAVIQTAGGSG